MPVANQSVPKDLQVGSPFLNHSDAWKKTGGHVRIDDGQLPVVCYFLRFDGSAKDSVKSTDELFVDCEPTGC